MERTKLDVAVIGAGTAGLFAMARALKNTENALLFEGGIMGTTCARVGCMPSKAIIHLSKEFAIAGKCEEKADIAKTLEWVREVRGGLTGGTANRAMNRFGNKIITETASFISPMVLKTESAEYECRKIIIATGSTPVIPPGWKLYPEKIFTTDMFFEQENLGKEILVAGLGPIGLELGQAMARLGIKVTGLQRTKDRLGVTDPDLCPMVIEAMENEKNFELCLGYSAELVSVGDEVEVITENLETGEKNQRFFDQVVLATGRRPNIDSLGLDKSGLQLSENGLPVFDADTLKCPDYEVYLAGDVTNLRPFYHDAANQGMRAGINAASENGPEKLADITPMSIIFTDPNICFIGKQLSELDPESTLIGKANAKNSGRAKVEGGKPGGIRLYVDKTTGVLLGAQLAIHAGEHMAHFIMLMIEKKMTVAEILNLPFYHPCYEELIQSALMGIKRRVG